MRRGDAHVWSYLGYLICLRHLMERSHTSIFSRPIFLHPCETCSELPSTASTMIIPCTTRKTQLQIRDENDRIRIRPSRKTRGRIDLILQHSVYSKKLKHGILFPYYTWYYIIHGNIESFFSASGRKIGLSGS